MTLYDQTKMLLCSIPFWCFPVATCCSTKALLVLNNATAHLAIEFLIKYSCKLLKIFSHRFGLCSTVQFFFGIVNSVSNFAEWGFTEPRLKNTDTLLLWKRIRCRSGTESGVLRNAIWCHILDYLRQCFSTGVPRNLRVPRLAARGAAETDWNCLGRNPQPQFYPVAAI